MCVCARVSTCTCVSLKVHVCVCVCVCFLFVFLYYYSYLFFFNLFLSRLNTLRIKTSFARGLAKGACACVRVRVCVRVPACVCCTAHHQALADVHSKWNPDLRLIAGLPELTEGFLVQIKRSIAPQTSPLYWHKVNFPSCFARDTIAPPIQSE